MIRPTPALLALLAALGGCALVDQRTFEATPQAPGASAAARAALPAHALLTIRPGEGEDWQPALREAVAAAQGRKPDVVFEVAAVVPIAAAPAVQQQALRQGATDAAAVARGLRDLGVDPGRIRLAVRGDAGNPPREVQIYVK